MIEANSSGAEPPMDMNVAPATSSLKCKSVKKKQQKQNQESEFWLKNNILFNQQIQFINNSVVCSRSSLPPIAFTFIYTLNLIHHIRVRVGPVVLLSRGGGGDICAYIVLPDEFSKYDQNWF